MAGSYPSPTFAGVTLNSPLSVANGGTGVTSVSEIAGTISAAYYVGTIADLRALTSATTATTCNVAGYSAVADGGGGIFVVDAADTTSADNGGTIIVDAAGRRWYRVYSGPISTLQFGCRADGTTSDDAALAAWWEWCSYGRPGFIEGGTYKLTAPVVWDVKNCANKGVTITGAGKSVAVFDLTAVTASQPFSIINSGNSGAFYGNFSGFGVSANYNGPAFIVGQESFADALNDFRIETWVSNSSTGTSACAVELNYVLNSKILAIGNCSGATVGDALRLRQAQFNVIEGSYSNALCSIHMTAGYNYGNTIISPDLEVAGTNLVIDSADAINNTIIGGQWQWTANAINATEGANNRIINPNFSTSSTGQVLNGNGITVFGEYPYGTDTVSGVNIESYFATQAGSKVGIFGAVPTSQPTNSGATAPAVAGSVDPVYSDTQFTGGIGSTAYSVGQIVAALKTVGIIQS